MCLKIIKTILLFLLWMPLQGQAIYIGNLTFSIPPDSNMVSKYVVNNNIEARIYRVTIRAIDRPGEEEQSSRPADGELLFSPRQLTLQPGRSELFKFHYHGPKDNKERYYRAAFEEIPTQNRSATHDKSSQVSMMPVVVMDTILVVRPRQIDFKWEYDPHNGVLKNSGNTWFRFLYKPGCLPTDEGRAWYLRPGERIQEAELKTAGLKLIVYDDKYIKITHDCG